MRRRGRSRVRDAIEVRAPGVDVERLFKSLEANLATRRVGSWGRFYIPSYDDLLDPVTDDRAAMPCTEVEYYLRRLRSTEVSVTPHVLPSNIPLVGRLLDLLKRQLHDLVLYYVNILAGKQAHYNAQVFRAMAVLSREIQRLRAEVAKARTESGRKPRGQDGNP